MVWLSPFFWRFLMLLVCMLCLGGCGNAAHDTLYQVATIDALLAGNFDGVISCGQLNDHGDFGLGTFDRLNGEMIVLDGVIWQVPMDGVPVAVDDAVTTPFANVTFFDADKTLHVETSMTLEELKTYLDSAMGSCNYPVAIRIDGVFSSVRARSVPAQDKPYVPLAQAAKAQAVFQWPPCRAVMVGIYMPPWLKGACVGGYHFHIITPDHTAGGHVLDAVLDSGVVMLDITPALAMTLPYRSDFASLDLAADRSGALTHVETNTQPSTGR